MKDFSTINMKRNLSSKGFNNSKNTNELFFSVALSEEVGEVCGVVKKLQRGFNLRDAKKFRAWMEKQKDGHWVHFCQTIEGIGTDQLINELEVLWVQRMKSKLISEMADVFIYWNLIANYIGLTKLDIINKFNEVNQELECPDEFLLTPSETEIIIK